MTQRICMHLPNSSKLFLALFVLSATCSDPTAPGEPTERLAFASTRAEGDWEIWSANPDGTEPRRLTTSPGVDIQPAYSTDRGRIAFYSEREPRGIYIMNADGTNPTFLCTITNGAEHLDWSPDDRFIVFQGSIYYETGSGIYVADVSTGELTLIRRDALAPDWSPDGSQIAFNEGLVGSIYVMNPDGSGVRELVTVGVDPAWSPDGSQIAFVNRSNGIDNISVASLAGGTDIRVVNSANVAGADDQGPIWSRNGSRIAFTRTLSTADIWTVRPDGSGLHQVTSGNAVNGGVAW